MHSISPTFINMYKLWFSKTMLLVVGGLVDFGLVAYWHRSGVFSPFQHLPPWPLGNTTAGLVCTGGAVMPLSNPSSNVSKKQEVKMLSLGETAGSPSKSELEFSKLLLSDHWHSHWAVQMKAAMQWCIKLPLTKPSICPSSTKRMKHSSRKSPCSPLWSICILI